MSTCGGHTYTETESAVKITLHHFVFMTKSEYKLKRTEAAIFNKTYLPQWQHCRAKIMGVSQTTFNF